LFAHKNEAIPVVSEKKSAEQQSARKTFLNQLAQLWLMPIQEAFTFLYKLVALICDIV
jgi:hypothetical protein